MNLKRFTAKSTRDAMALVRQEFGDDAVVLSNKPVASGGVEIVAMAPEGLRDIERMAGTLATTAAEPAAPAAAPNALLRTPAAAVDAKAAAKSEASAAFAARVARSESPAAPAAEPATPSVDDDVSKLAMSTLSFQDYVRTRMLKRRQAALNPNARSDATPRPLLLRRRRRRGRSAPSSPSRSSRPPRRRRRRCCSRRCAP